MIWQVLGKEIMRCGVEERFQVLNELHVDILDYIERASESRKRPGLCSKRPFSSK